MKSDDKRREEIEAFRRYARLGLDRCVGAAESVCRIRGACTDREAVDMLAVSDVMRMLTYTRSGSLAAKAVREVYFTTCRGNIRSGIISGKVRYVADSLHCDERTVYRGLTYARSLWRELRDGYLHDGSAEIIGKRKDLADI
ncbi:MAG: hypothetical protein MJ102_05845 [Clostridia bacterium]|nr:hypothetical protein [Clostridia bacterium]